MRQVIATGTDVHRKLGRQSAAISRSVEAPGSRSHGQDREAPDSNDELGIILVLANRSNAPRPITEWKNDVQGIGSKIARHELIACGELASGWRFGSSACAGNS